MSKGAQTRREILGTALALASEVGFEALSIGTLAERVGMSKSGLFAHFTSKERLQIAVLEEAERRFVDLVIAPALRTPRGLPRLRALFEHWLSWTQQDFMPGGCIFMTVNVELDDRPGPARDKLAATQRDWLDTLAETIRIAKREGHLPGSLDEQQMAFELFGLTQSAHLYARLLRDPEAFQRARRAFSRLVESYTAS